MQEQELVNAIAKLVVEQLKNVEGIGDAKLEALIPQIKIGGNDS